MRPDHDAANIRYVTADQACAAIAALGFSPDDVYALEMTPHNVTIHYHTRYDGKLNGRSMAHTVPIDRKRAGA